MYKRAKELLQECSTVKVFAPSGAWGAGEEKDSWIDALCGAKDKKRCFIAGGGNTVSRHNKVLNRLNKLNKNGVETYLLPATEKYKVGVIIFDSVALFGLGKSEMVETRIPSHLDMFSDVLAESIKHEREYRNTK